jgi:2-polyprenyl-3-methyl-5-hydroxy-6-metoxy-1,4-benzoquinol methylase
VAGKVLGIDADPKAITYATRNYRLGNLSFRLMDVCNMALANKAYDAAVSFEVIEHLTDVDSYLEGVSNG